MEVFGEVDILLNNAATGEPCMMKNLQYQSFERVLRTNTWSGIRLAQLCRASLKERGNGVIVNIASDDALYPSVGVGAYSMSKICQIHFTKQLAVEYRTIYAVRFRGAVYVLHAFQKKSTRGVATPGREIDGVTGGLNSAEQHYRHKYGEGKSNAQR